MGESWIDDVRVKLARLAQLDPDRQVFGAATHDYHLNPCATNEALERFEQAHELSLPADYRAFLHRVGNGGAGPAYGLAPLAAWRPDSFSRVVATLTTRDGASFSAGTGARPGLSRPADPAMPFVVDQPWRPYDDDGKENPPPGPADANPYDGCTYLADLGCGYFYFLVLNGARAGEVWVDYTAGDGELCPVAPSFRQWYEDWVDASLANRLLGRIHATFDAGPEWEPSDEVLVWAPVFERRFARDPESPQLLDDLAYLRIYEGRYDEAATLLARLVELAPEWNAIDDLRYLLYRNEIDAAADPTTPAERLVALASSTIVEVRRAAASNPNTPAATLERLIDSAATSFHADPRTHAIELDLYVRHPSLPGALYDRLLELDSGEPTWQSAVVRAVAQQPGVGITALRRLARHAQPWVREAAVGNDAAPDDVLTEAAADPDALVRRSVATHPHAAAEVLAGLAGDRDEQVTAAVASNPSAPVAAQIMLARTGSSPVLQALAQNPRLAPAVAECLAHSVEPWVRRAIAAQPGLPPLLRRQLAHDPDSDVRANVALWTELDEVTLRLLASDDEEEVRAAAAVHPHSSVDPAQLDLSDEALLIARARSPHTPPDELAALARHQLSHVREAVAGNPRAPEAALALLARDELLFVRDSVPRRPRAAAPLLRELLADPRQAASPNVPVVALAQLVEHEDNLVPYAVAAHPWTPVALLAKLARHRYAYTRVRVAEHAATHLDTLASLRADDVAMVRAAVAANRKTPALWLPDMAADPEDSVREAVAMRPDVEPPLLRVLAADPEMYVRRGVTRNPAAPLEVLARLAADPDAHVREWLCRCQRLPAELLARLLEDSDQSVARAARFRQLVDAL